MVGALEDFGGTDAAENFGDVRGTKGLVIHGAAESRDAGEDFLSDDLGIGNFVEFVEADIAGGATSGGIGGRVLLAEVLTECTMATTGGGGDTLHLGNEFLLSLDDFLGHIDVGLGGGAIDELKPLGRVGGGVEQDTLGGEAIAASAAGFLLIGLDAFGHGGVYYAAHVGAIDTHAEGDGSDDDVQAFGGEVVLDFEARFGVESGVVCSGIQAAGSHGVGEAFGLVAGDAVDDCGLIIVPSEGLLDLVFAFADSREDSVGEVWSIEDANVDAWVSHLELIADVGADAGCGGGGVRMQRNAGEDLVELGDSAVFRSEVVAPLADAVGFVDGDIGHASGRIALGEADDPGEEALGEKAFRGDEQEGDFAGFNALTNLGGVGGGDAGMQSGGGISGEAKAVDLVFHQGDERGDDQPEGRATRSEFAQEEGRKLIAEGLAATGGQDGEGIELIQSGGDRVKLQWTKIAEAPGSFEDGAKLARQIGVLAQWLGGGIGHDSGKTGDWDQGKEAGALYRGAAGDEDESGEGNLTSVRENRWTNSLGRRIVAA